MGSQVPPLTAGLTLTLWKLLTLNPARSLLRGVSVLSTVQDFRGFRLNGDTNLLALRPARNDGQNKERKWMDSENSEPLSCVDF